MPTIPEPSQIGNIVIGHCLLPNIGFSSRAAQAYAGIPLSVPSSLVNAQCSSGLASVANIAMSIKANAFDIGLACGVESSKAIVVPGCILLQQFSSDCVVYKIYVVCCCGIVVVALSVEGEGRSAVSGSSQVHGRAVLSKRAHTDGRYQ